MTLTPKDLSLLDAAMQRVVEPGEFDILVGASSTDIRLAGRIRVVDGAGAAAEPPAAAEIRFPATVARGGEVTFPVRDDLDIGGLTIRWSRGTDCAFEILISDGGGQFLPVFSGKAAGRGVQECVFEPTKASEVRISVVRGKGVVVGVENEAIRK